MSNLIAHHVAESHNPKKNARPTCLKENVASRSTSPATNRAASPPPPPPPPPPLMLPLRVHSTDKAGAATTDTTETMTTPPITAPTTTPSPALCVTSTTAVTTTSTATTAVTTTSTATAAAATLLPPPTVFDRAAVSLTNMFSPDQSPLTTPPTTPSTTPMNELHLIAHPLPPLDGVAPSTNLRQELLKRKISNARNEAECSAHHRRHHQRRHHRHRTNMIATNSSSTERTQEETWSPNQGHLCFRMLWWFLYSVFLTFFVFVGEILPAIQEGVLRASRVFLSAPSPRGTCKEDREEVSRGSA
jgi:hypothetical protein